MQPELSDSALEVFARIATALERLAIAQETNAFAQSRAAKYLYRAETKDDERWPMVAASWEARTECDRSNTLRNLASFEAGAGVVSAGLDSLSKIVFDRATDRASKAATDAMETITNPEE